MEYVEHTPWQSRDILIRDCLGQMARALEVKEKHTETVANWPMRQFEPRQLEQRHGPSLPVLVARARGGFLVTGDH